MILYEMHCERQIHIKTALILQRDTLSSVKYVVIFEYLKLADRLIFKLFPISCGIILLLNF